MADSRMASRSQYNKVQRIVDFQQKIIFLLLSIIFAFGLTYLLNTPDLNRAQLYVLFILFLSISLWVTEAVPPFTVGLLIIGFLVFALGNYYHEIEPESSNNYVQKYVQTWSNSVIWLMLGGFFMAEAMQKVGLDKMVFKTTINKIGTNPRYVLLGVMLITGVISMVMSNTATTAMMIAAVLPFVNAQADDSPFCKALLLGIPAAASLGGMGTLIGSPPNAIAVDALNNHGISFGFLEWMIIGFPVAIIMIAILWFFLIKKYVPRLTSVNFEFAEEEGDIEFIDFLRSKRRFVLYVLLGTLALWLTSNLHGIPASAVSLIPIILLTMFRIISSDDVRRLPWDTLMLVAGGLSLGLAIQETGLAIYYIDMLQGKELNFIVLTIVFSFLTVILSNFMSNTATATILIPIAIALVSDKPVLIPLVIGLSASTALFLPISTPPNAIAFSTNKIEQKEFRYGGLVAGLFGPVIIILFAFLFDLIR